MNIQYYAADGTVKNLGDDELQHWKYIKKIKTGSGWRYFYSPEELRQFYNEGKKKVDSIPRLQKHGEKYYIADKKTQRKIEKSGAGGNMFDRTTKHDNGGYGASTAFKNRIQSDNYKERARANSIERKSRKGISKVMKDVERASNLAKSEASKSAAKGQTKKYEKYEAKNVLSRPFSSIKKKTKKGKKKTQEKYTVTTRTIKEKRTPISEVTLRNGTTMKYNMNNMDKKRKKSK